MSGAERERQIDGTNATHEHGTKWWWKDDVREGEAAIYAPWKSPPTGKRARSPERKATRKERRLRDDGLRIKRDR